MSLEQLEQEANDEFLLLESVGAEAFSTVHLLELRDEAVAQLREFDRRRRVNMLIGATAMGWVLAFALAYLRQNIWLAMAAVVGLVFSLTACIAGAWLLTRKYRSRGYLVDAIDQIEAVLHRR